MANKEQGRTASSFLLAPRYLLSFEAELPWRKVAGHPAARALSAGGWPTGEAIDSNQVFTRK
jgi:hypothetical protein